MAAISDTDIAHMCVVQYTHIDTQSIVRDTQRNKHTHPGYPETATCRRKASESVEGNARLFPFITTEK